MANTATAAKKSSRLITPPFRVSFPSVFEKSSYNNGTLRFSLTGLFWPKTFDEADKQRWLAIKAKLNEVSIEAFKKPYKELGREFKIPYHKGDEKDYQGYGDPAMVFHSMANSKRRPQIRNIDGSPITQENAEEFYAGCWARASVNPYAFNNIGKGLAIGLGNLQKIRDDESFEGFTSADDDFGGEFGGSEGGDEFGPGGGDEAESDDDF